jgi:hypothetical protein
MPRVPHVVYSIETTHSDLTRQLHDTSSVEPLYLDFIDAGTSLYRAALMGIVGVAKWNVCTRIDSIILQQR